jgi:hypothetical protein
MTGGVLAHATAYAKLGLAILPLHIPIRRDGQLVCSCGRSDCSSPGKHPIGRVAPQGSRNATKDGEKIGQWFGGRLINVGIATGVASGIFVLDIDPRHEGDDALDDLETKYGPLPLTWRFLTGGGGEHIVFRLPSISVANSAGKIGPGIDVRGDGGYIVAPPSLHMSGRPYAISVDHHPDEVPLADAPEWLLKIVIAGPSTPTNAASRLAWREVTRNAVPEGQRNQTIARLAGLLLTRGVDPHVTLDLMLGFNTIRCAPPLGAAEVTRTVASIARRDARRRTGGRYGHD